MSGRSAVNPAQVTQLLQSISSGDRAAFDHLIALVYGELREVAARQLRREHGTPTINATALVHDAYVKMAAGAPRAEDRQHFLAIAARAMRQVLVEAARRRGAAKRGGEWICTTLSAVGNEAGLHADELLALDAALEKLPARQSQIVELRYFGGMEEREIGELLDISERTVRREWTKARAWLYRELYLSA